MYVLLSLHVVCTVVCTIQKNIYGMHIRTQGPVLLPGGSILNIRIYIRTSRSNLILQN